MNLTELITKTRSYRRFDEKTEISDKTLTHLANLGRLAPSAQNAQPIKYALINKASMRDKIFPLLAWAGYLTDWDGPTQGERPTAYIVVLNDTNIQKKAWCDDGLSTQNILLGATELGLGGCIIGAIKRDELRKLLAIPSFLEIRHVIALGKPIEKVVLEPLHNNDYKYWRSTDGSHHVPKRSLDEIVFLQD